MTRAALEAAHKAHHRLLWNVGYRMTGSRADADELVQEAFVRALEAAPTVSDSQPLAPWLVAVTTRLAIDALRARQARSYVGPWLPQLVPSEAVTDFEAPASAQYDVRESASIAFLLALEVLTPRQRAAVVLCEVLDWSSAEAANALETSQDNVRQLRSRAHQALLPFQEGRPPPEALGHAGTKALLEQFFGALLSGDSAQVQALLEDDAVALTDGGGVYSAARVPVVGKARVELFLRRLLELRGPPTAFDFREVNGATVIDAHFTSEKPSDAPRSVTGIVAGPSGRIRLVYAVTADAKLPAPA